MSLCCVVIEVLWNKILDDLRCYGDLIEISVGKKPSICICNRHESDWT